jgi:hypothetical protein
MGDDTVQIPSKAVSDGEDLRAPTRSLLEDLNLLGNPDEVKAAGQIGAVVAGPPQSVALIEAGATAVAKWWAAGAGAAVLTAWGSVVAWWADQGEAVKVAVLGAAALVTAALVLAIGHLLASDVRGRAAAAVSAIEARASVANVMLRAAQDLYEPPHPEPASELIPLPAQLRVKYPGRPECDEHDWRAVALERQGDGTIKYILVKGSEEAREPASALKFDP